MSSFSNATSGYDNELFEQVGNAKNFSTKKKKLKKQKEKKKKKLNKSLKKEKKTPKEKKSKRKVKKLVIPSEIVEQQKQLRITPEDVKARFSKEHKIQKALLRNHSKLLSVLNANVMNYNTDCSQSQENMEYGTKAVHGDSQQRRRMIEPQETRVYDLLDNGKPTDVYLDLPGQDLSDFDDDEAAKHDGETWLDHVTIEPVTVKFDDDGRIV